MKPIAQKLVPKPKMMRPSEDKNIPKQKAAWGESNLAGKGREEVRGISASSFRSIH